MDKRLGWVFLFVFIDVLGFSLILPLLPYYATEFDAKPSVIGLLMTSNALSQMICAPVLGALSDTYGRRPLLLLSIAGTVVAFLIMGSANSIFLLFFSRILDGVLGGNISLAQAYIADVTEASERSKGFGIIGAAFGLGFIVGPAIGGTLSVYGFRVPAFTAAAISILNLFGVLFFLPESLPVEKRKKNASIASHFPLTTILKCASMPLLGSLMFMRFCYTYTFTLFETCFGFYNLQRLGLDARTSSYFLAYVGILYAMVQGGGVKAFTKRITEGKLILYCCLILSVSLVLWVNSFTTTALLAALFPVSLTSGLLNTLINSEITKQVEQSELGGTLGLSAAIGSLTRVIAPVTSGFMMEHYGIGSPGISGAVIMAATAVYMYFKNLHKLLPVPVAVPKDSKAQVTPLNNNTHPKDN